MFSAGGTYFNVELEFDGSFHHLPVVKQGTLAHYIPALCKHGLTQAKLCDANIQLTYKVDITKEKR